MMVDHTQVEYNRSFRLYLQTRLQNPHYRPEVPLALNSQSGNSIP